jgi:hypothetical protein
MPRNQRMIVFLSHSHVDRDMAVKLQAVLEKSGADTFLDQDHIEAGDVLPDRIVNGIESSDALLLLWSVQASASAWVRREWETALRRGKRIIPYKLDSSRLPAALEDRAFVEPGDQMHAHVGLLRAVFGASFTVAGPHPFPGKWHAELVIAGVGAATYEIELRANGQIHGTGQMQPVGLLGTFATQFDFSAVLSTPIPVHGSWTYESVADVLTLTLTATAFGAEQTETIEIRATSREAGSIEGSDLAGRTWRLTRVPTIDRTVLARSQSSGDSPSGQSGSSSKRPTLNTELQRLYDARQANAETGKAAAIEVVFRTLVSGFAKKGLVGLPAPSEILALSFDELVLRLSALGLITPSSMPRRSESAKASVERATTVADPDASPLIFLGYSPRNERDAQSVYQQLKLAGYTLWMDKHDLVFTKRIFPQVQEALARAEVVLLCFSKSTETLTPKEYTAALEMVQEKKLKSRHVVPVKMEECELGDFSIFWHVDWFRPDGPNNLLTALKGRLP